MNLKKSIVGALKATLKNRRITKRSYMREQATETAFSNKGHVQSATDSVKPLSGDHVNFKDVLHQLSQELESLTKTTESEFLSIGEMLHDFSNQANTISETALACTHFLTGSEIEGVIGELQEMLERIGNYLRFCEQQSENDSTTLENVIRKLEDLDQPLEAFGRVAKRLRILSTSTRIENAYLERKKSNFDHLIDGVVKLSDVIKSKSSEIHNGTKSLGKITHDRFTNINSLKDVQYSQAKIIVENVQDCLESLREEHRQSSDIVSRISQQSHGVSQRIAEIVTSMQFHDITRQKIEHVKEAIDDVIVKMNNGKMIFNHRGDNVQENQEDIHFVGDICILQKAQLQSAKDEVLTALDSVINSLSGIQEGILDISQEARRNLSSTDKGNKSFVIKMGSDIKSVTSSLYANIHASRELMQAMDSVTRMVDKMGIFVDDIDKIGSEIELIAMNGQIKAAHLGEDGAAMSVLADAIQRLSAEAQFQIISLSESLKNIATTTSHVQSDRVGENDSDGTELMVDEMIKELDGFLGTIENVNDKVLSQLDELQTAVMPFSIKLQDVISKITVNVTFDNVLSRSIDIMEDIVGQLRSLGYITSNIRNNESVESIEERYTMDSERHVHQAMLGSAPIIPGAEQTLPPIIDEDDELGNNVELF